MSGVCGNLPDPVAHDGDGLLQCVNILKVTLRQPDLPGMRVDAFDFVAPLRDLRGRRLGGFPDLVLK